MECRMKKTRLARKMQTKKGDGDGDGSRKDNGEDEEDRASTC